MIVDVVLYRHCEAQRKPERSGPCFVGYDLGGTVSLTAAAAYWPDVDTGLMFGAHVARTRTLRTEVTGRWRGQPLRAA